MVLYLAPKGATKCEIMKIHPYLNFMIGYTYQAAEMNLVNEEKDLGMWCTGLNIVILCTYIMSPAHLNSSSCNLLDLLAYSKDKLNDILLVKKKSL